MNSEEYTKRLEQELDIAKAKYNEIYNSVRSVDRIVHDVKAKHNRTYRAAKKVYQKIQKAKTPELAGSVVHNSREKTPLKIIASNWEEPRLNLILDRFDERALKNPEIEKLVLAATKQANDTTKNLRIISRNNLPNPKLYVDFLAQHKASLPEKYSFYSDIDTRVSSPIHRLEVSHADVFYNQEGGHDA